MEKILLAVDGSVSCDKAVVKVAEITKSLDAEVTIMTVIEEDISHMVLSETQATSPQKVEEQLQKQRVIKEEAKEIIETCSNMFDDFQKVNKIIEKGNPSNIICQKANEGDFDLVVVSDKGLGAVKKFLLGSTTEKVVRHCSKSVLVVK